MMNDQGNVLSAQEFNDYCQRVESSAEWGGQIELQAISKALKRSIHVIQMGTSILKIGEAFSDEQPLFLSYHRHAYGLGEHYNSLIRN